MNKEIESEIELELIIDKLKESINPFKKNLFGSYAYGNPSKNSDIDLLVVTNNNHYPKNYKEKMDRHIFEEMEELTAEQIKLREAWSKNL